MAKQGGIRLLRQLVVIAATAATLLGCLRRFEPAAAPAVTSPDAAASARFAAARSRFDGGGLEAAEGLFKAFVEAHAGDPLAPLAQVYRGRIALRQGRLAPAKALLEPPAGRSAEDPVGLQARYYLGLTCVRLGEAARGRQLLTPFLGMVKDDDRPEVLAALARAAQDLGQRIEAAGRFAALYDASKRPTEQRFARRGLEALVAQVSPAELRTLHTAADAAGLLAALTGARLAALEAAAGRWSEAEAILSRTASARATHGVSTGARPAPARDQPLVGLLVPFSGRYRAVGRQVLDGAVEASGTLSAASQGGVSLAVRDSSGDAAAAARELVETQQVDALAGVLDPAAARAVAEVAARAAVPFVTLARLGPEAGGAPFSLLPDNAARAGSLARHAAGRLGLKRVVIARPETTYGRAMAAAFTAAFVGGGRVIAAELPYPAQATSFSDLAKQLAGLSFDGLFVPDSERTVGLLAPALARAGLWTSAAAGRQAAGDRRRSVRALSLLSTADGLSSRLITTAGRYLQGATLAPGYFADLDAPGAGPLARGFEQSQGHPPALLEALGFDCVRVFVEHGRAGAADRASLLAALRGGKSAQGLTGRISFSADGRRRDRPLLYRVEGQRVRQVAAAAATARP